MTEPQIWTLIGVFAAGMLGMTTLMSTMFLRMMQNGFDSVRKEFRSEFDSVRTEFRSEFATVRTEFRSEFTNMRMEIENIGTEIRGVDERIDHLDHDVNAIYRHLFGIDRG